MPATPSMQDWGRRLGADTHIPGEAFCPHMRPKGQHCHLCIADAAYRAPVKQVEVPAKGVVVPPGFGQATTVPNVPSVVQDKIEAIILAYAEHKGWCPEDVNLRIRRFNKDMWETCIGGFDDTTGFPFKDEETRAPTLMMSLSLLVKAIVEASEDQFKALKSLRSMI